MQKGTANVRDMLEIEDGLIEQQKRKRGCNQSAIRIYCTRGLRIHHKVISRKTSARHSVGQREVKDRIVKDLHFITKIWCLDRKLSTARQKGLLDLKEAEKGIPSLVARPSNICKTLHSYSYPSNLSATDRPQLSSNSACSESLK